MRLRRCPRRALTTNIYPPGVYGYPEDGIPEGLLKWTHQARLLRPRARAGLSTSTAPASRNAEETGGVAILKKGPAGDVLAGPCSLFDSAGKEAGSGKTDANGQLVSKGLVPGVYRLQGISSGSKLHGTVDDQDVFVTSGAAATLTITDPFMPASVVLKVKDDKSGNLLAGPTVNIGSDDRPSSPWPPASMARPVASWPSTPVPARNSESSR